MSGSHSHHHNHHHHHHHHDASGKGLYWAVVINIVLTIVQVIGGLVSGSLSLLADALHNLSDAGALVIALVAAKIGKIPPNEKMTYGYKRAEILGALINSTTLVIVGLYLLFEAVSRYFNQEPIDGWIVVIVAGVALVVDLVTAFLTYSGAKDSVNIRAAFIHNLSDAMASVVVIISGTLILLYETYWVDLVSTVLISIYVLYHSFFLIKQCIAILMQRTPPGVRIDSIKSDIESLEFAKEAHHIHVWQLDDKKLFFEGHVVIDPNNLGKMEQLKQNVRTVLKSKHNIAHSTIEVEVTENCPAPS